MDLRFSLPFDADSDTKPLLDSLPSRPGVFALFPHADQGSPPAPYLGRSRDLRRRLLRLLSPPRANSRMLNLRPLIGRIDYQFVGSGFEAQWLLYVLNRDYYPAQYRERLRLKPPALLRVSLRHRFPRCHPTRRLSNDGSAYYGPFPSQVAAERFAAEFLDFFKIRRCVEDLRPDPSHPGCVYSQLRMCLAPCFAGCTEGEYREEVMRVVEFLDAQGRPLLRSLETERSRASAALEFEQAAKTHRRIEKVQELLRQEPELVRNLLELHAVVVQRGAEANSVVFFRVCGGELQGPVALSLDENVSSPVPLDEQLHNLLDSLAAPARGDAPLLATPETRPAAESRPVRGRPRLPPWEHLSLLARWYYSSFREGELVMLARDQAIPHTRLIRVCRKLLSAPS